MADRYPLSSRQVLEGALARLRIARTNLHWARGNAPDLVPLQLERLERAVDDALAATSPWLRDRG